MTKEQILASVASIAATLFATPVFVASKSTSVGEVADDATVASLGQILEPGKYLVHSVTSSVNRAEDGSKSNSIRWNLVSELGVPCSIYNGTLTKGVAVKSAVKAGLLGTFGQAKEKLIGKSITVQSIERGELDANNRRPIKRLDYVVEEF